MRRGLLKDVGIYLLTVASTLVFFFPIYFLIQTSLKSYAEIITGPPLGIAHPTLSNYIDIFTQPGYEFTKYLVNSLIISLTSTFLAVVVGFPAAYSIARFNTGGGNLSFYILSLRLLPPIIFAVPLYVLYQAIGLVDTHLGLILLYTAFNLPLTVFVLMSFISELPLELEEAALVDGASRLRVLTHVVLPLSLPGIIAVTILNFMACWNEYLFALIFTFKRAATVTVGASLYITAWQVKWGHIAAAISVSVLPTLVFVTLVQKYLVKGLTLGALKV